MVLVGTGLFIAAFIARFGAGSQAFGASIIHSDANQDLLTEGEKGLSNSERSMLSVLAEHMVPSDGTGPGAREAAVVEKIVRMTTEEAQVKLRLRNALRALNTVARACHNRTFVDLDASQQIGVMKFVDGARKVLWDTEAYSFWEKVERKANWYYYRWYGVTNEAIEGFDTAYTYITGIFYSSQESWAWLGYEGPPFPFGYAGRISKCGIQKDF
jgi:hypothetical protein